MNSRKHPAPDTGCDAQEDSSPPSKERRTEKSGDNHLNILQPCNSSKTSKLVHHFINISNAYLIFKHDEGFL